MGFVKSCAEIAAIERVLQGARYVNAQRLTVEFLVDPAVVAGLLPPPLRPGATPRVTATVGRWQSSCAGDFDGGAIHVSARHGDVEGAYVLAIYMSSDPPIFFGRDMIGEPKKLCRSALYVGEGRYSAWLERNGVRLIELQGDADRDLGPGQLTNVTFNFKARTAANGIGLEEDPILTRSTFENTLRVHREGSGRIALGHTVHDPFGALGDLEVTRAVYAEYDATHRCEAVARIPAAEFLPYHYGRMDDWRALDTAAPA